MLPSLKNLANYCLRCNEIIKNSSQEICNECDQILMRLDTNKDFQSSPLFQTQIQFKSSYTKEDETLQDCVYCTYLNKPECTCFTKKKVLKKDNTAYKKRVELLK